MFELTHKTAIVTGAANGIGKAIATLFHTQGANIVAADFNADELRAALDDDARIAKVVGDISDDATHAAIIEAARSRFGGVDILVNNAGIVIAGDYETLTDEQWDTIMTVNVRSVFV